MVFYSFKHLHIPETIFNPSLDVKKKKKKVLLAKTEAPSCSFIFDLSIQLQSSAQRVLKRGKLKNASAVLN